MVKKVSSKQRSIISETWEPDEAGRTFAAGLGIDPAIETESFRDYHLANGSLMLSWAAAWRTWCRNQVKWGRASGKPAPPPLVMMFDANDPFGVRAWAAAIADAVPDTYQGRPILTVGGYDVVDAALGACGAAGWPPSERVDLEPVAQWLRDGIDPDTIAQVIRVHRKPDRSTLRYFDSAMRRQAEKRA